MRSFKVLALALGAVAAVVLLEGMLRVLGLGYGSSPMEPDPFLHHVHPRNFTFVQQHPSGELGGFTIHYNNEGRVVRGDGTTPEAPAAGLPCRVALMGDSFTEGGQVPFDLSFAGLLEEAGLGTCEVRNYGVRSYSPAIYLVQWTREVRAWNPTHVFVLIFGNDVREDVIYLDSAVLDDQGWPTAIAGPSGGQIVSFLRRLYVARLGRAAFMRVSWAWENRGREQWHMAGIVEENPDWAPPTPDLLKELDRRVRADGAEMILMAVPSRYRLMGDGRVQIEEDFHERIRQWSNSEGLRFLDLHEAFARASAQGVPLFFLQDIHFNEEGHALTAAVIGRGFRDQFPRADAIAGAAVSAAFGSTPPPGQ